MAATVRIDFDVNAGGISEALKGELSKAQTITASANSVIEAAQKSRITSVADDAVKAEQKVTAAALSEKKKLADEERRIAKALADYDKQVEKESEVAERQKTKELEARDKELQKQQKYLSDLRIRSIQLAEKAQEKADKETAQREEKEEKYLANLRLKSIADANKAQEKADKEHANAAKKKDEHGSGGGGIGLAGGLGIGAAIAGFQAIKEHAEAADKAIDELHIGISASGLAGKQLAEEEKKQTANAIEFSNTYKGVSKEAAMATIAQIAEMSHKTGGELKSLSEDAIILAHGDAAKADAINKILGKATNEEIEGSAAKLGIALDKNMTAEQRAAKIHEEAMKRKKSVQDADNDSLGSLQQIMNKVMTTVTEMAGTVLDALKPAIDAVVPVIDVLGKLVGDILGPVLAAITPVITLVAQAITQLAPPITILITSALKMLTPIIESLSGMLGEMIPVIIDVVNTVVTALTPVFEALTPIISNLTKVFAAEFMLMLKVQLLPMMQVLIPVLTDSLIPAFMAILPAVMEITKLMMDTLVPAFTTLGNIISSVMEHVLRPLIKFFSGIFVGVIKGATKIVEDVIGAIKKVVSVVSDVISFFGGGEAKAAVKETTKAVVAVTDEGLNEVSKVVESHDKAKTTAAAAGHKAAIKAAKDAYTEAKNAEEQRFKESEIALLQKKLSEHLTDEEFQKEKEKLELDHITRVKEFSSKFHKDETAATIAYLNLQIDNQKKADAKELDALKLKIDEKKDAASEFATDNNLTDKQQKKALYEIEVEAYESQIALLKKQNADVTKITLEFGKFQRTHAKELITENRKDSEEIAKIAFDTEKARIDAMVGGEAKEKELLRISLADETQKEKQELLQAGDNEKLKDAIHQQHEEKRNQISKKFAEEEKHRKMEQISYLTGPFISGFSKATDSLNQKFFQPILNKWINQKTFIGGILGDLTTSIIKFATEWIAQKALAAAADLLFHTTESASMAAVAAAAAPAAAAVSLASFGANSIAADAGMVSSFGLAKLLASTGFKDGGFTGYGNENQIAGPVHKNEFVLRSGSFAVDSNGNLISVAGMGGGNNAPVVDAIQRQTEHLGQQFRQSKVINQRRMVLENKVSERSRSRETV